MTRAELLGLVRDAFVYDDRLARMALADALKEEGWEEDGAALVKPAMFMPLVCPRCETTREAGDYETNERFEDDECGDFICLDYSCDQCGEVIETEVFRPVCRHTYHPDFSNALRMRHAD